MASFRPGWPVTAFAAFFVPVFIGLGVWQLDRAAGKTQLLAEVAERQQSAPVELNTLTLSERVNFTPVKLAGAAWVDRLIYLDNRVRSGRPGVEVLLPVQTGDQVVLVNLGFAAKLGRINLPPAPTLPSEVVLSGYLYAPDKPRVVLVEQQPAGWPRLMQRLDWPAAEQALGAELVPWQVRIDPEHPLALETDWVVSVSGPERHRGYAVQWLAMALALSILYIIAGLKGVGRASR